MYCEQMAAVNTAKYIRVQFDCWFGSVVNIIIAVHHGHTFRAQHSTIIT